MPDQETVNPRLVVPGDKIIPKGLRTPEVVRSVAVIVRMANGTDVVYEDGEEVKRASEEVLTPSEEELLEAHTREVERAKERAEEAERRADELADLKRREEEALERQRQISEESTSGGGE